MFLASRKRDGRVGSLILNEREGRSFKLAFHYMAEALRFARSLVITPVIRTIHSADI